jgi:hypothetical protein
VVVAPARRSRARPSRIRRSRIRDADPDRRRAPADRVTALGVPRNGAD